MHYRTLIYVGTLLTGFTGLVYQVIWQKHLSTIVGSEARSTALVVAVFLFGLAAGYRYWGKLTERSYQRRSLLRLYGLIEIGIGLYAAAFPLYVRLIRIISTEAPGMLLTDIGVTLLTLLVPTFCMGATIPLLVAVVPRRSEEVHLCHAKIYGVNTLGACLGAFGASFFLIPRFGLTGSLLLGAGINLVVGTMFLANRLQHSIAKKEPIDRIPSRFDAKTLYLYTLTTGTITLSLEILFVRVLNLTIGAGPHNFAMIVGVFVFGLALGSLVLTNRMLSVKVLFRAIVFLGCYLMVLFYSIPYWPYWMSNVRAALTNVEINYWVYLFVVTGFLMLVLLPFLVPLGFMLPLVYAFLPKGSNDYGKTCGWLYFYNTLGTALGSIVLSYVLLHFFDLDVIFKIDVLLLAALLVYLAYREKRTVLSAGAALLALVFLVLPGWDRGSHYLGLFSYPGTNEFNFQGFLGPTSPKPFSIVPSISYFDDGPDMTVTVADYVRDGSELVGSTTDFGDVRVSSKAMINNGRSEGDTVLDYSTMILSGVLPYLYGPDRPDLEVALIGLGSGVTSGILGRAEEVQRVRIVEIAPTLIEAAAVFEDLNFQLSSNEKIEMFTSDGFKYLARLEAPLDIIVSEPSVPWVVGVENLFTLEFHRLVYQSLKEDGVFMQWFPLYTVDPTLLRSILANLHQVFPHLRLFRLSSVEVGVLASRSELRPRAIQARFAETAISRATAKMQFIDIDQLLLIHLYDTPQVWFLSEQGPAPVHTLDRPSLAYASDRIRVLRPEIDWERAFEPALRRLTAYREERGEAFRGLLQRFPDGLTCSQPYEGVQLFCELFNRLRVDYLTYAADSEEVPWTERVKAYDRLRQEGVQASDVSFLARATDQLIEYAPRDAPDAISDSVNVIILSYVKDGLWEELDASLSRLRASGLITDERYAAISRDISGSARGYANFVARYQEYDPSFSP